MKEEKNNPIKQRKVSIIVAVVIAIALLFHLVTFQVRKTEKGVITTFGKPTKAITKEGLYWKLPYPFQDYFIFDARIQIFTTKLEQTFTADGKNVIVETFIGWRIDDPIKFLMRSKTIQNAQRNLEPLIRSYTNSVIAKYPFHNLISEKEEDIKFEEIEEKVLTLLNEGEKKKTEEGEEIDIQGVKESLGIVVEIFGIKRLELPESTTQEVFARMKEERDRIVQSYISEGEGKAQEIKAQADAEKKKILIEAKAKAKEIKAKGDEEAAKYYKIFDQNRELAIWLSKKEALEKLLSKKTTIILDANMPPFDILKNITPFTKKREKNIKKIEENIKNIEKIQKNTKKFEKNAKINQNLEKNTKKSEKNTKINQNIQKDIQNTEKNTKKSEKNIKNNKKLEKNTKKSEKNIKNIEKTQENTQKSKKNVKINQNLEKNTKFNEKTLKNNIKIEKNIKINQKIPKNIQKTKKNVQKSEKNLENKNNNEKK